MKPLLAKGFFYFRPMLNPLKTGDKVAIVATAKRLEKSIEGAISIIESWGLEVVLGTHVMGSDEYWAASNEHSYSVSSKTSF